MDVFTIFDFRLIWNLYSGLMERILLMSKRIQELIRYDGDHFKEIALMLKSFSFFHNLEVLNKDSNVIEMLSRYLKIETFEKDSVVYTVNSRADRVFLILEGQVQIYKSIKSNKNPLTLFNQASLKDHLLHSLISSRRLSRVYLRSEPWSLTNDSFTLSSFESFGEEVLSDEPYRLNTVIAKDTSTFLTILNTDYIKTIRKIQKQTKSILKVFLKSLDLFQKCSSRLLDKIIENCSSSTLSKNQVLYKQGDPADFVYFIQKGEFLISQTVKTKIGQDQKCEFLQSPSGNFLKLSKMRQKSPEKNLQVVIKAKNEMLGGEEVLNDLSFRKFSCVCVTDSAVLVKFSKENFLTKVLNAETVESFKRKMESRVEWRQSRIEAIQKIGEGFKADFRFMRESEMEKKFKAIEKDRELKTGKRRNETVKNSCFDDDREQRKLSRSYREGISLNVDCRRKVEEKKVLRHRYIARREPPPSFLIGLREKIIERKRSVDNQNVCYTLPF